MDKPGKDTLANSIADEIRKYFEVNRVSQKQVAAILGVTQSTVSVYLAGRPFSDKIAEKWAEAFGFSTSFLTKGSGTLVPNATDECLYPRTEELTKSQLRIVAEGYVFLNKEAPEDLQVSIASIMRPKYEDIQKRMIEGLSEKPLAESKMDYVINTSDIYKWQNDAMKEMREQITKQATRLFTIESIIGEVIGLGAETVSALPTKAISTLLLKAAGK